MTEEPAGPDRRFLEVGFFDVTDVGAANGVAGALIGESGLL